MRKGGGRGNGFWQADKGRGRGKIYPGRGH